MPRTRGKDIVSSRDRFEFENIVAFAMEKDTCETHVAPKAFGNGFNNLEGDV